MLSIIIITKNEEANIRRCLESVTWAHEVIVLDSGSTDKTVSIAREYTDKVYTTTSHEWRGYGVQKQRALAYASNDWVLNLDADEVVNESLKAAILSAINTSSLDAYRVAIRMCFYGKIMRYSSCPTRHIRLFKREGATFSDDFVHEKIILPKNSRIGRIKAPIIHQSFQDIHHALEKMNRYSSYSAKIRMHQQKTSNVLMAMLGSGWMFFRCYVLQRGFLDGKSGLLLAIMSAEGSFYRAVKQIFPDRERIL